jgi:hypothetical protein
VSVFQHACLLRATATNVVAAEPYFEKGKWPSRHTVLNFRHETYFDLVMSHGNVTPIATPPHGAAAASSHSASASSVLQLTKSLRHSGALARAEDSRTTPPKLDIDDKVPRGKGASVESRV